MTSTEDKNKELEQVLIKNKIGYKLVSGVYQGQREFSFVCGVGERLNFFIELLSEFNQECLLYSNNQRESELIFQDSSSQYLGKLKTVDKNRALQCDNYTYCPSTDCYYICEELTDTK